MMPDDATPYDAWVMVILAVFGIGTRVIGGMLTFVVVIKVLTGTL